jgi:nicotinamide riboside transporter PnuC
VAKRPTALSRLGVVGLVTVLFLPEAAILVLIGIAAGWWLAGILTASYLAFLAVLYIVARWPKGLLGRLFGAADHDPGDYSWYTPRNLFLRPFIIGLPAAVALIIVAFMTANESGTTTVAIAVPCAIVGYLAGGFMWSWMESRRRRAEATASGESLH